MREPHENTLFGPPLFSGDVSVGKGGGASSCTVLDVGTSQSSGDGFGNRALGCDPDRAQELWRPSSGEGRREQGSRQSADGSQWHLGNTPAKPRAECEVYTVKNGDKMRMLVRV